MKETREREVEWRSSLAMLLQCRRCHYCSLAPFARFSYPPFRALATVSEWFFLWVISGVGVEEGGGGGGVGKKFCAAVSHDTSRATPCELVTYVQLPTAQDFSLSRADAYRDFCWS